MENNYHPSLPLKEGEIKHKINHINASVEFLQDPKSLEALEKMCEVAYTQEDRQKEGEKKERWRVLVMSEQKWASQTGIELLTNIPRSFHPKSGHNIDRDRFCIRTENQLNYFKRIS